MDPAFAASVRDGDVIVAGRNFGCGSAMEVAATVVRAAGIRAVVAKSFARSFYRNAINNGLLVVACDTAAFGEGDAIHIAADTGVIHVVNGRSGAKLSAAPLPPIMTEILAAGGLVGYLRANGSFERAEGSRSV